MAPAGCRLAITVSIPTHIGTRLVGSCIVRIMRAVGAFVSLLIPGLLIWVAAIEVGVVLHSALTANQSVIAVMTTVGNVAV